MDRRRQHGAAVWITLRDAEKKNQGLRLAFDHPANRIFRVRLGSDSRHFVVSAFAFFAHALRVTNPETPESKSITSPISRSRVECLFDGIFAIAMTILVLELKVPELADRHSAAELWHKLVAFSPTFGSYLLSFLVLGMFWYRHNEQYYHCQSVARSMLAVQFVQLALAAFFPFCAALFGRYPTNALSQMSYLGCVFLYLWAALGHWLLARRCGALKPQLTEAEFRRIRSRLVRSVAVISITLAGATWQWLKQ